MKIIPVIICMLLLSGSVSAYPSMFGKQSTYWVTFFDTWALTTDIDTIYAQEDTVVNSLDYKKLSSLKYGTAIGLLREDTAAGKVWYKSLIYHNSPDDTAEIPAFDFALQKGDTFDAWNLNNGSQSRIVHDSFKIVDSVYVLNNLKYICFKAHSYDKNNKSSDPATIIEGIGSNYGILWKELNYGPRHYLLCSYKDGVKTAYTNIFYKGDCNPPKLSINNVEGKAVIEVYPNPVADLLYIKGAGNFSIRIVNTNGVEVLQAAGTTSVDVSALPADVYFYFIGESNNPQTSRGKFVKY